MAVYKKISKDNLVQFLQELTKDRILIAPVREHDLVSFSPAADAGQVDFTFQNSFVPPKSWFFPQTEQIFSFRIENGKYELSEPSLPGGTVLFGVRPCDLKSILALDPVFDGKFDDNYYSDRRKNTIIIGLGCQSVGRGCFCFKVGGGPLESNGADIFLTPAGGDFLAEGVTDQGTDLINKQSRFFSDSSAEQVDKEKREGTDRLLKQPTGLKGDFNLPKLKAFLDANYEIPYWEELSYRCLGCGICTYLCPTCHCFDINDYARTGLEGERIRCWDSCQFKDFTLMAGGHNPRPSKKERVRNRFMHKFKYHEDRYSIFGCVGCGRCVQKCPVNIDPRKIILDLQEVAGNE
jgi:ferredoxin